MNKKAKKPKKGKRVHAVLDNVTQFKHPTLDRQLAKSKARQARDRAIVGDQLYTGMQRAARER